jgi:hypothetical protein
MSLLYKIMYSSKSDSTRLYELTKENTNLFSEALKHKVLIRTIDKLLEYSILTEIPEIYFTEKAKNERMQKLIINDILEIDKDQIFIKNFMHLPDMGDDIDLYVRTTNLVIDYDFLELLQNEKIELSYMNKIGGRTQYYINEYEIELEIYHGKYGRIGEYMKEHGLFEKYMSIDYDGSSVNVPIYEDQILVQIIQSLYNSGKIRVSDVIYFIDKHVRNLLNYEYLDHASEKLHITSGYRYYVNYVNRVIEKYCPNNILINENHNMRARPSNLLRIPQINKYTLVRLNVSRYLKSLFSKDWIFSVKLSLIPVLFLLYKINNMLKVHDNK